MAGLVYCRKNHVTDAVLLFEKALQSCPWQKEWRENLIRAYQEIEQQDKAEELKKRSGHPTLRADNVPEEEPLWTHPEMDNDGF